MFSVVPYACLIDNILNKTTYRYEIFRSINNRLVDRVIHIKVPQKHITATFHVLNKNPTTIKIHDTIVYRSNSKNFEEFLDNFIQVLNK